MNQQAYTHIEHFLEDPSFVAWVHQTDPEAITFWNHWRIGHPEQLGLMEEAAEIVRGLQFSPQYVSEEKVEAELGRLRKQILKRERSIEQANLRVQKRKTNLRTFYRFAASFLLLAVLGLALQYWLSPTYIQFKTQAAEMKSISLADGTELTLGANSRIRFQENQPRKVWLDGEAFFWVADRKASNEQFQVITTDLVVQVFGTEFNVNSRKKKTEVILEEGSVKLELQDGTLKEMIPGDVVIYSGEQNKILAESRLEQTEKLTSWKDGTLIFEDISLQDAMDRIAEVYSLDIVYEDKEMAQEKLFVSVPMNNLDICILAIERSGGIQLELSGKTLTIKRLDL